jgi:hypothetical protein
MEFGRIFTVHSAICKCLGTVLCGITALGIVGIAPYQAANIWRFCFNPPPVGHSRDVYCGACTIS